MLNLQDFLDIDFKIEWSKVDNSDSYERRRVLESESAYQEVFQYAKENDDYFKIRDFAHNKHLYLGGVSSKSGNELSQIELYVDDKNITRCIIYKDTVRMFVYYDKISKDIYIIEDAEDDFGNTFGWNRRIFERFGAWSEQRTIKDIINTMLDRKKKEAQCIRNYYNNEIKKLKRDYKEALDRRKLEIATLIVDKSILS